jgi:hypothetical protein
MAHIANAVAGVKSQDSSGERDLLLTALRTAAARSRLITNELDTIGVSLRQKVINCEQALAWAKEEGLLHWIKFGPEVQS